MTRRIELQGLESSTASSSDATLCSSKSTPVRQALIVSSAPPAQRREQDGRWPCASTGVMPKSSRPGKMRLCSAPSGPANHHRARGEKLHIRFRQLFHRAASRPLPAITSGSPAGFF